MSIAENIAQVRASIAAAAREAPILRNSSAVSTAKETGG